MSDWRTARGAAYTYEETVAAKKRIAALEAEAALSGDDDDEHELLGIAAEQAAKRVHDARVRLWDALTAYRQAKGGNHV